MKRLFVIICLILLIFQVSADNDIVTIPIDGSLRVSQIDYGRNVSLTEYALNSSVTMPAAQSWELLGSINGNDYTLLDIKSGVAFTSDIPNEYPVTDTSSYRYFLFVMTKGFYQTGTLAINLTTSATTEGTPGTDFYLTSSTTTLGTPTGFIDASTNTPYSWYWMFGDGTTSTVQNPYHTYSAYGYYTVNHSSTNINGLVSWNNKTNFVTVNPTSPVIVTQFSGTPVNGIASLPVSFTDTSVAMPYPVTSWLWSFGDGGTSTSQNPSHTYNTPGVYSVSLLTTNANTTNTTTYSNYITVTAPIPNTAFVKSISNDGTHITININRYHYGSLSLFNPDTGVTISTPQTITYLADDTTNDKILIQSVIAFYGDDGSYWIYRTV